MKRISALILALLLTAVCSLPGWTGTLTSNQFLHKPSLGARGQTEKNSFDAGLDRVDARLGKTIWVGDPAIAAGLGLPAVEYITALDSALAAIGSTPTTLHAPRGNYSVSDNTTIPANVSLKPERGAIFSIADGKTLTIGSFDAGLYQCFTWAGTGKVVFASGAVKEIYPQWFGAVSGTGNDCSAAYLAAINSMQSGQVLLTTDGIWRLASPLVTTHVISWRGIGSKSQIYLDVGSTNDGITFGDTTARSGLEMTGLYLVGPANSCKDALVLSQMHRNKIDVQICTGAVGYGARIKGCVYGNYRIRCASNGDYNYRPANGVILEWATSPDCQTNRVDLDLHTESQTGYALYIGDGNQEVINVTGSIEYATGTYAIYAKNVYCLNVHDLYGIDGNTGKFHYEGCQELKLTNFHSNSVTTELVGCSNSSIDASEFGILNIDPTSINTTIGNIALGGSLGGAGELQDAGQNTTYTGAVRILSLPNAPLANKRGNDQQNVITNANLERWQSDRPDGWGKPSSTTWTKCGDGLADTTRRGTRYCAKSSVNANGASSFALDTDVKRQCLGNQIAFSAWIYHASGQNPTQFPYVEVRVVDGTNKSVNTYHPTPLSASTDDAWQKINVSCFVPATATDVQIYLWQFVPTGGGTNNLYLSEPCLFIGANPPSSYAASRPQGTFLEIEGHRITFGTAPPSSGWWQQGDVRFNLSATVGQPKGWQCTVSGSQGTWVSMGNL